MPLDRVTLRPGVNTMASRSLNSGGFSDANLVRFRQGLPEKMGGWTKFSIGTLLGTPRTILPFAELAGDKLLGVGTSDHVYMLRGGTLYDITAVDRTVAINANTLATTSGSPIVTVTTAAAHGLSVGDYVTFDTIAGQTRTASTITGNGITFGGQDYVVVSAPSTTTFTFAAATNATATGTLTHSSTTLTCYFPSGSTSNTAGLGWGAAGWGVTAWGQASSVASTTLPLRLVSLDAWGQTLLACPTQARLLSWSPDASGNVSTRLSVVTNGTPANGPSQVNGQVLVGSPERHAIALGAGDLNATTNFDPMLVRWSDTEDYTTWKATSLNAAGSFRVQGGSQIVAGYNGNNQTLIWTDTCLHTMRFIGLPYVYSFTKVAEHCGIISQRGFGESNGIVYWMGARAFWSYHGGSPQLVPCPMLAEVFNRLNIAQKQKVTCGTNSAFNEVTWFYPADGASENTRYITFNTVEQVWYGGALGRTCWADTELFDNPIAADATGQLWSHENGDNADSGPMGDYIVTGYWDMSDGEAIVFASQIIPDFIGNSGDALAGNVQVTFYVRDYPNGRIAVRGPYPIGAAVQNRNFRARGREMAMRIESVGASGNWRLGNLRVNYQKDGTR